MKLSFLTILMLALSMPLLSCADVGAPVTPPSGAQPSGTSLVIEASSSAANGVLLTTGWMQMNGSMLDLSGMDLSSPALPAQVRLSKDLAEGLWNDFVQSNCGGDDRACDQVYLRELRIQEKQECVDEQSAPDHQVSSDNSVVIGNTRHDATHDTEDDSGSLAPQGLNWISFIWGSYHYESQTQSDEQETLRKESSGTDVTRTISCKSYQTFVRAVYAAARKE